MVGKVKKAYNVKYFIAAAVFALLALVSGAAVVSVKSVFAATTYSLTYNTEKTVITGITVNGSDGFVLDIPEQVVEISENAFKDEKIAAVNFAANGRLVKIGNSAFSGTSVKEIVLPGSVTEISASAFANCSSLQSVKLPDGLLTVGASAFADSAYGLNVYLPGNANATYAADAFGSGSVFICEKADVRDALKQNLGLADNERIAYPVEIRYNYLGTVIDTETRLFGKPYNFVKTDGVWKEASSTDFSAVGTELIRGKNWKWITSDSSSDNDWIAPSTMTMLLAEDGVEVIDLYATATGDGKVFIARNDVVYDGSEHRLDSLSSLLMPISDRITSDMKASIKSYTKPGASEPVAEAPKSVCDAGLYVISVDVGEVYPVEFTVNVARKKVDLASYDKLFWRITEIGDVASDSNLMSSSDTKVYLYKKTADGTVVPSYSELSAEQIAEKAVDESYEEKTVRYSLVRSRGEEVTVSLGENEAYDAEYGDAQSASEVGVYNTTATLTAKDNYEFVLSSAPADAAKRGVTVIINDDGKATVTKEWYIVDINNWVKDVDGKDYEIAARAYGEGRFPMPYLAHDVDESEFGKPQSDKVVMKLYYEGKQIGEPFRRDEFDEYLNAGMPAGDYVLDFSVGRVPGASGEWYDAFDYSVSFTVEKARMREGYIKNIDGVLKDSIFVYSFDGRIHLYSDDESYTVSNALEGLSFDMPQRSLIWMNSEYDEYFGDVVIEYNLKGSQSDEYSATANVTDPDEYTVYYKVSAKNYLSSLDVLDETDDGSNYYFTVIITREIIMPTISAKKYNGERQIAEIEPNDIYYIIKNEGGVSVGTYEVVLKLRNPACYKWYGDETGSDTLTLDFVIEQATNGWISDLSIQNWITGRYDPEVNKPVASAKFGNENKQVVITDADGKVVYDSVNVINELKSAGAGTYGLRVVIAETDDYTGISDSIFFRIHEKPGLVWWGILLIVAGSLGVAALVLVILWKKGVIELLTGKITLAIRTKATVDATIAAVRANKIAEESRLSIEQAKAKERAQQRKAAADAEKALPAEEKAAALEAKAKAAAERAERMRAKSEAMQARAERMREEARKSAEQSAQSAPEQEAAATTDDGNNN